MADSDLDGVEPIAIIGIACRVPGARNAGEFWRNMRDGVESIRFFTPDELRAAGVGADELATPEYVAASGYLDDADMFDARFFGFNPAEAEAMDPQHRLFCETTWAAVEDSGHDPAGFGGDVGVFAGAFMNKYLAANLATSARFQRSPMAPLARMFNDKDFLATRVSYLLGLTGPACTVQTACSTSLVATHLACQSLLSYECDTALAGGVTVNIPLKAGYPVSDGGLFSPDGHCRPFDARSSGTVPGNGVVVVVLRRLAQALADRDHIYAVIRGSAINNDGSLKAGFAAPSVAGQARVIASALAVAGVDPATVGYVEAHGTATQVGDPIEVAALAQAMHTPDGTPRRCALGSVKANIGHLDAAAGVAGLVRAALAIHHGQIPPNANFTTPNPELRLAETPFYVPAAARDWRPPNAPRRAGVSSFGVGGTNAHVVLEQAPAPPPPDGSPPDGPPRPWQLLPVSGASRGAADAVTTRLGAFLEDAGAEIGLPDAAFTLQAGRRRLGVRKIAVCSDTADAVRSLLGREKGRLLTRAASDDDAHEVAFAFPGGGAQHPNMGLDIYQSEPVFRNEVDQCADLLRPRLGFDLRRLMFPAAFTPLPGRELTARAATMGRDQGPAVTCSLFTIEYALARQFIAWGVPPAAMIGHSLGEYVAACLAGVFTLPGALEITLARGEIFAAMPPGRMLVIRLPEAEVAAMLPRRLSVSAVNAPDLTVVAGPDEDIAALLTELRARRIDCRKVSVPVASHSWMVDSYLDDLAACVRGLGLSAPQIPFVSGVTGTWITAQEAADPAYWARHLRQPVRFADGVAQVLARPGRVLLEVGPGRTLTALAAAQRLAPVPVAIPAMGLPRDTLPDLAHLVTSVGRMWQHGIAVDWAAFHRPARPRRVPLPGYPFERQRHWVEPGVAVSREPAPPEGGGRTEPPAADWTEQDPPGGFVAPRTPREVQVARIWCDLLGIEQVSADDDFFDLGGHSLMVTQMARELRRMGATQVTPRDVLEAPTVADMAALVDRVLDGGTLPVAKGPSLAEEVVLDEDIDPRGLPGPAAGPPGTVLLTGATGFVGAFLCAQLLSQTRATVVCLVRAADAREGAERVQAALRSYGLPAGTAGRLPVITGDLARPLLGLSRAEFDDLAQRVDSIYHCGAWVNFVRPYRALKAANVSGTQEILRLAARARLKPVHYISTLAALAGAMTGGREALHEDDPLPGPVGHDTAYSQSKWVAEGLVEIARSRGIPVSVYRAGGVLADSRSGAANTEDYVTKVIQGCVQLGLAPLRDYPLSVVTVDHMAALVVGLSLRPQAAGRNFHTIDPRPLPWNRIFEEIRRFGYPVRSVPFGDWRQALIERVEQDGDDNALAPLLAMIGDTPDREMPVIDCANVTAVWPDGAAAPPGIGPQFFGRLLGFMARARLLPEPATAASAVMTAKGE